MKWLENAVPSMESREGQALRSLTVRNRSPLPARETKDLNTIGSLEYFYLYVVLLCSLLEK